MNAKSRSRYERDVSRPCEANTGTFKRSIDTVRLKALGADALSLLSEDDRKPRRCLDDIRKLSEEIKRNRRLQQQTMNAPRSQNAEGNDEHHDTGAARDEKGG